MTKFKAILTVDGTMYYKPVTAGEGFKKGEILAYHIDLRHNFVFYRSLTNNNTTTPATSPKQWERVAKDSVSLLGNL